DVLLRAGFRCIPDRAQGLAVVQRGRVKAIAGKPSHWVALSPVAMYGKLPYNCSGEDIMAFLLKRQRSEIRKIERVEARLNPEQKRRIEYAASLKGSSISDFM